MGRESAKFVLEVLDERLCIRLPERRDWKPLAIDWLSASVQRRGAAGPRQALARAVGLRANAALHVIDATAGIGRDGYTLAALGARVTLLERQAPTVALLRDAQRRAVNADRENARIAAARIEIVHTEATVWLAKHACETDAIYLDPMYPEIGKSALPQKEMQLLRALDGGDADADALLLAALATPARRVVVKRSAHAPWLADRRPQAQIHGTQTRFDLYLRASGTPRE